MAARNIFLVLHVTALLLAFLPFLAEGTDRFVSLAVYSAMLYPLALLLERGLYPLVSLLLVSTACHLLFVACEGACGTVRWGVPKDALFLFSIFHLLSYVSVPKRELEVMFPVLQLAALLSIQSTTLRTGFLLLSAVLCVARTLGAFKSYHSEDLILFMVAVGCSTVFQLIDAQALFTVFFALSFAASVDVRKGRGETHFLGLLGEAGFTAIARDDI